MVIVSALILASLKSLGTALRFKYLVVIAIPSSYKHRGVASARSAALPAIASLLFRAGGF